MLVPLATLEVTAARADADRTFAVLQRLRMVQIVPRSASAAGLDEGMPSRTAQGRPPAVPSQAPAPAATTSVDGPGVPTPAVPTPGVSTPAAPASVHAPGVSERAVPTPAAPASVPTTTQAPTPAATLLATDSDVGLSAREAALVDELLGLVPVGRPLPSHVNSTRGSPLTPATLRDRLPELTAQARALRDRLEALRAESESLPHHLALLRTLVPLIPELSKLDDAELATLGLASIAVVLDDPGGTVTAALRSTLAARLGDSHLMVASAPNDTGRVSAMVVLRRHRLGEIRALLGAELIGQLGVPAGYAGRSLRSTIAAMHERLDALPAVTDAVTGELAALLQPLDATLRQVAAEFAARCERAHALHAVETTARTFTVTMWVPRDQVASVTERIDRELGSRAAIRRLPPDPQTAPVLLRNRPPWHPYQELVSLLSWPSPRTIDPTSLMAMALPMLFGLMVGDVGYGLGLLTVAWLVRRRARAARLSSTVGNPAGPGRPGRSVGEQAAYVLGSGALWAIGFGLLFGEFFGSLGHHLGMPALWFYRGGAQSLATLLLLAVGVGFAHVVLALGLGVWTAHRLGRRGLVAERLGHLGVLAGLFGLAGVAAQALPTGVLTPAVALVVVGLAAACASQGLLGLLLGPLGALGVVGNVLSYLRLAAVGLASVYLAGVANELAVHAPLLLGVLVAAFFHALNLALAAFSPMVQALRLHYVEFFGQFHDGQGRPFTPLGAGLPSLDPPLERT